MAEKKKRTVQKTTATKKTTTKKVEPKQVEKKKVEPKKVEKKEKNTKLKLNKKNIIKASLFLALIVAILVVGSLAIGTKKTILILGVVLLLGVILLFGQKYLKKSKKKTGDEESKNESGTTHKTLKVILLVVFTLGIIGFALIGVFIALVIKSAAPKYDVSKLYNQESSMIYDRDGKLIAELAFEKREIINYEELPEVLINAIIATEDSRFFQHNGFDILRFTKASAGQLLGRNSGGASTLTMQISKNRFTSTEASGLEGVLRKFQDIYLSVFKLERDYTKKEIIEIYTNSFYLGGSSYGVEQACKTYFGKSAKDINLAEAALIAGLYQAPDSYDPLVHPEEAETRRQDVLYLMELHNYITKEEREIASKLTVPTLLKNNKNQDSKQYLAFINTVIKEVEKRTGKNPYYTAMHIYSTMDSAKQAYLDKIMYTNELWKWENPEVDAGIVILQTGTAEIAAIAGGRKTVALGYNTATDISNQIGSTSKPLYDYGPAIEFNNISTYNIIADEPYKYSSGATLYNYDYKNVGLITTRNAVRDSRNVPALKTFQSVNREDIKKFVTGLHLHPEKELHEAHSLGGYNGESPLSLAGAYQAIANGGYYIEPHSVRKIVFVEDGEEFNVVTPKEKAMKSTTAYMLTSILITTAQNAYGSRINGATVASKTGTTTYSPATLKANGLSSNAVKDLWYTGFNKEYTLTVWYGYHKIDKKYYSKRGNKSHRELFVLVGKQLFKGNKQMSNPGGVVSVRVEKESYPPKLPSEFTPKEYTLSELFINGTQPTEVSTRFSRLKSVTNLSGTYSNGRAYLSWTPIGTPDPLSEAFLRKSFDPIFTNEAFFTKWINERIAADKKKLGNLGYRIYIKNPDGSLESVGYTYGNSFSYPTTSNNIVFVVKSEYDIFNANASYGAEVNIANNDASNVITAYMNGDYDVTLSIGDTYIEPEPPVIVRENMQNVTSSATVIKEIKVYNSSNVVPSIDTSKKGKYVIEYTVKYKSYDNKLQRIVTVK